MKYDEEISLAHIDLFLSTYNILFIFLNTFLSVCLHKNFFAKNLSEHIMPSNPRVKYHRVNDTDGYVDAQFRKPPPKVPVKAICLASGLFFVGTILLVIGSLLFTGYFDVKYADRTYPMLILGSLMFIPGFYHVRIAYYAWKGYRGYSFEDIPDFN